MKEFLGFEDWRIYVENWILDLGGLE